MENASKALLIAAAVLIVILLIAFGVGIFNSARTAGDASGAAGELSTGITQGTSQINSVLQETLKPATK